MKNIKVNFYLRTAVPFTDKEMMASGAPIEASANVYDSLLRVDNTPPTDKEIINAVVADGASRSIYRGFVPREPDNASSTKAETNPSVVMPRLTQSMYHAMKHEELKKSMKIQIDDNNLEGFQDAIIKVVQSEEGRLEIAFYQDTGCGYYVLFNRTNGQDTEISPRLSAASGEWMDQIGESHCKEVLYPLACEALGCAEVQAAITEVYGGVTHYTA